MVESFKTRFGNVNTSSSLSWAYSDLVAAMHEMKNGAEFAEAFWLSVEDSQREGHVAPTLSHVNKLYVKHGFPFEIDPPHLRRTDHEAPPAGNPTAGVAAKPHAPPAAPPKPTPPPTARAAAPLNPVTPKPPLASPTNKPVCFVAQPFHEPFQGRFDEDIEPAIEAAGMSAYKVDKDLAADKLIEDIHQGIERATVVLVDITEDNSNVWYELGYSQALGKLLVMISCTTEREAGKPYPFDVQGRKVIEYAAKKRSDLDKLQRDVTARIRALVAKEEAKPKPRATFTSPALPEAPPNGFATMDPRTRATLSRSWGYRRGRAKG